MASGVRPSPFGGRSVDIRDESELQMLRQGHRKRMGRSALHSRGEEKRGRVVYNDQGLAQSSGYWRTPKRPPMKRLTDSAGNEYYTPDVIDWDDWVDMFRIHAEGPLTEEYKSADDKRKRQNMRSLADYCNWSFDREDSKYDSFSCPEGHIERVDYNNGTKIMRVRFRSGGGATCCYFYVPAEVYSTMKHLSDGMPTRLDRRGVARHLVGIYFWDLVRVRGTVHGNRYECCYAAGDDGGLRKVDGASPEKVERMMEDDIARTRGVEASLRKDGASKAADSVSSLVRDKERARADFRARVSGSTVYDSSSRVSPAIRKAALNLREDARRLLAQEDDE